VTATVWLTVDEVMDRTTLLEPDINRLVVAGDFPPPVKKSDGTFVWREIEINEWIETRPRATR
jgi:predicted DNA-binding transcriptional regulator AlpA